jgi:hypothetical protein
MKFLGMMVSAMLAVLLASAVFCADAAELRIEALALPYASPWQRATPQQESLDDALLLDAPEAKLQLAVLRPTAVKSDAASYYAKLTRKWRALYGGEAKVSEFESGGAPGKKTTWLVCRRPARDHGVRAFHLVTLFEGRAYSLLLFAPSEAEALPTPALDLLAALRFGPEVSAVRAATNASKAAWKASRTIYPHANADVLAALVRDDVARLGDDGMVTGYGLNFSREIDNPDDNPGATWFIEGYQWKTVANRTVRATWNQGGRLDARIPVELAANWGLRLSLRENEADLRAQLQVWELCAASPRVAEVLENLQSGERAPLRRLALERAAGCPAAWSASAVPALQGESGKSVRADVAVALPPALGAQQNADLRQAGLERICLVEIGLHPGSRRTGFGDRLIERARWYVVLEPVQIGD